MKNKEVLMFWKGLNELRDELSGRVFNHAVTLNQQSIEIYVKALNKTKEPSKEMQKYIDDMEILNKEHALKDENGNPVLKRGVDPQTNQDTYFYDIQDNNDPNSEYFKTRQKLFDDNKSFIDSHNEMIHEWVEELLEKKSEFKPILISLKDVTDDINKKEMAGIIYMINGQE